MSDAAASSSQRDRGPRRGALHGRLLVSEYVGQSAADAAQAIRRAGLRPGLERSLGCDPEAIGHVLAQEPTAGSELARNAVVTIYVGAPGASPIGDQCDEHPARGADQPMQPVAEDTPLAPGEPQAPPTGRRRRKPRPPVPFDTGPAEQWIENADLARAEAPGHYEQDHERLDDPEDDGLPKDEPVMQEELVTHADDVLAGRAGAPRRGVYPTRRRLRREQATTTSHINPHQRR
jgi:hypothetical protein